MKLGFDGELYKKIQSDRIRKRINDIGGKLYLEFGGKLFDDYHASRVLPGFAPDSKIRMLATLKDDAEVIIAINANDVQNNKLRGDLGITYEEDTLRLIDKFNSIGLNVTGIVITQYASQPAADDFTVRLKNLGVRSYKHYPIKDYPSDIAAIVSDEGFGKNDYVETTHSLVVVTAPGPGSGKMATCLSQLYHDNKRGIKAGYAKFETFPVWDLPLDHPINLAYEAATADLKDENRIDPFHKIAYNETAVNYNRDIEIFPVLQTMFNWIQGESPYRSPTDMGVNTIGRCISDDAAVCTAAKKEILRRYMAAQVSMKKGRDTSLQISKIEALMKRAEISEDILPAIAAAEKRADETGGPAAAMQLPDGSMVTGKTSELLGAASSLLLNALKRLGNIDQGKDIIPSQYIAPICHLKTEHLGNANPRLHSDETLIALSSSAVTFPEAEIAMQQLKKLEGLDAYFTVIVSNVDEQTYKKLGINVICSPVYESGQLYHK